ncbi:MAG: ribonuclease E/G, partial [Nitrosomonas sp.]|nr:ribonuclease E/G [Nitrosomonas sp.]
ILLLPVEPVEDTSSTPTNDIIENQVIAPAEIIETETTRTHSEPDSEYQVTVEPHPHQTVELPDLAQSGLIMIETAPDKISETEEVLPAPSEGHMTGLAVQPEPAADNAEPLVQVKPETDTIVEQKSL